MAMRQMRRHKWAPLLTITERRAIMREAKRGPTWALPWGALSREDQLRRLSGLQKIRVREARRKATHRKAR